MDSNIEIIFIILLIFMLGASIGSFIGALVYRREEGISILSPPSFCDYCGKRILKRDLVPVFSFILLRGKTRCCGKKISIDKVFLEILGGLGFVFAFFYYGFFEGIFIGLGLSLCLLISFTDYKFMEIYDRDLKVLLILAFIYRLIFLSVDLKFLAYSIIFSLDFLLIRWVSKGGLGDGDLFFYLGLFCFLENSLIPCFILFSILVGAGFAIIKALRQRSLKGAIALCPAISIGFLLVLFFKDYLWKDVDLL